MSATGPPTARPDPAGEPPERLRCELVRGLGFTLARLAGPIDDGDGPHVHRALSAVLMAHRRVVADCGGLRASGPAALALLCQAYERAGGWPDTRLCLYALADEQARWYRDAALTDRVPLRDSMPAAVAALDDPPPVLRRTVTLPPGRGIARYAREVVKACAHDWQLSRTVGMPAALAASEVVNGAVEAGADEVRILVELLPDRFEFTVLAHGDHTAELGTLTEVTLDAFADTWSTAPTRYGRRTTGSFAVG